MVTALAKAVLKCLLNCTPGSETVRQRGPQPRRYLGHRRLPLLLLLVKILRKKSANHCNLIIEKFLTSSNSIFRCSSSGGEELSHDAEEQLPGDAEEEDEGTGKSIDLAGG